uniref:Uncharacterized protein n=1 Tax=Rhipicephalus microplus TaxID=6941 RepID=A0A6G5AGF9_RHIMP
MGDGQVGLGTKSAARDIEGERTSHFFKVSASFTCLSTRRDRLLLKPFLVCMAEVWMIAIVLGNVGCFTTVHPSLLLWYILSLSILLCKSCLGYCCLVEFLCETREQCCYFS